MSAKSQKPCWKASVVKNLLLSSTEMVVLTTKAESLPVHKGLLCHFSEYYRAALDGGFSESIHGPKPVDELTATQLFMFATWLGSGKLLGKMAGDKLSSHLENLIRLYVFADSRLIPALRSDIIARLISTYGKDDHDELVPTQAQIHFVYEHLQAKSPLCRFFVELCARRISYVLESSEDENNDHSMPSEFVRSVMASQADVIIDYEFEHGIQYDYHESMAGYNFSEDLA